MVIALSDVRFRGQSGHPLDMVQCPLMTQSGHRGLGIAAAQLTLKPISQFANPCCNCVNSKA
jgi:hypothetical protein